MKKALDLWGVQIHCDYTVCACYFNRISTDTTANRDAWFIFLVSLCIAKIGDNDGDRFGTSTLEGVYPEEQFHKMIVGRKDCRLHYVDPAPSHIL